MDEIWRPIKGYEGLYEVSNMGRIRSLPRMVRKQNGKMSLYSGKILNPSTWKNGKQSGTTTGVTLWDDGKRKTVMISRMVAIAFLPNPNNYKYVTHIDGNSYNNRADNLQWASTCSTHLRNKINVYDLHDNLIGTYESMTDASKKFKISVQSISNGCYGKVARPKRYVFRFAE